jgi:hypothetical protein
MSCWSFTPAGECLGGERGGACSAAACSSCRILLLPRCPACRAFMPEYEKVALHYADQDLTVARVDCATQVVVGGGQVTSRAPEL